MKISVCTPSIRPALLTITQQSLEAQTFTDFEWLVEIGQPSKGHDLNQSYNKMISRATGDIFVSLQDSIKVPPDYLQKWVDAYDGKTFFTAPVGKTKNLDFSEPYAWDWRAWRMNDNDKVRDCKSDCWEIDNGMCPMEALREMGGFDEYLDQFWSSDNVSVGLRAEMLGYKFKCLFDNPGIAFDHDAFIPHPFRGKERPALVRLRFDTYQDNPKLDYLYW